ncbi:MAG TPA: CoA transferase, partial [Bosea sp. (in: a-proteobacteria)]
RVPSRWSASQPAPSRPAPRFGEHTGEVLRELGLSAPEIAELQASGAVLMPRQAEAERPAEALQPD